MGAIVLCSALPSPNDVVPEEEFVEKPIAKTKVTNLFNSDGVAFEDIFSINDGKRASSAKILNALTIFRAYCVLAQDQAIDIEENPSGIGALPYLIEKFGNIKVLTYDGPKPLPLTGDPTMDRVTKNVARRDENVGHKHENTVVEYSRAMGEARYQYTGGIGKYILDQVDNTMMAGTNIVVEYKNDKGESKMRLDIQALGLNDVPDMFHDLSVNAGSFRSEQVDVAKNAAKQLDAAKIWIHDAKGRHQGYFGYTGHPTQSPTATPTSTPTSSPTATPTKAPTKHPTRHPTKYPTKHPTFHPCISGEHHCNETPGGVCMQQGSGYTCGCKEGYTSCVDPRYPHKHHSVDVCYSDAGWEAGGKHGSAPCHTGNNPNWCNIAGGSKPGSGCTNPPTCQAPKNSCVDPQYPHKHHSVDVCYSDAGWEAGGKHGSAPCHTGSHPNWCNIAGGSKPGSGCTNPPTCKGGVGFELKYASKWPHCSNIKCVSASRQSMSAQCASYSECTG